MAVVRPGAEFWPGLDSKDIYVRLVLQEVHDKGTPGIPTIGVVRPDDGPALEWLGSSEGSAARGGLITVRMTAEDVLVALFIGNAGRIRAGNDQNTLELRHYRADSQGDTAGIETDDQVGSPVQHQPPGFAHRHLPVHRVVLGLHHELSPQHATLAVELFHRHLEA